MDTIKNFARGTLASGINSSATTATTTTGHGARFATTAQYLVIWNQTDFGFDITGAYLAGEAEIVRGTRSGETWTITRGQDGTSAVNLNTGGKTYGIAQIPAAAIFAQLQPVEAQVAGTWSSGITVALTDTPQRIVVSVAANGSITISGFAAGRRATLVLVPDSTPRTLAVNQNYPGYASLIAAPTVASTPREIDIACDGSAYTDVKLAWADIA